MNPARLSQMFARIQNQWRLLGESEPHWSVLTNKKFKKAEISRSRDEFNSTGKQDAVLIDLFFEPAGIAFPAGLTCLELGCGVGRTTRFLAPKFKKIYAADVSDHHIRVANDYLKESGIDNVDFVWLKEMDDLRELPQFDFFFSFILLQDNPPPVQLAILETVLAKVKKGGGCLFQVATEIPHYSFSAEDYLNSDQPSNFEMHSLPMHEVLTTLQNNNFAIREVRPDNCTGQPGSFTIFCLSEAQ